MIFLVTPLFRVASKVMALLLFILFLEKGNEAGLKLASVLFASQQLLPGPFSHFSCDA